MKIVRVESRLLPLRLAEPYTIAYETVESADNVLLVLETDSGLRGLGCAAPDEAVTGETAERTLSIFRDVVEPVLRGTDPFRSEQCLQTLAKPLAAQPAARAAVDMALHDLLGKQAGLPVWKLLGGFRSSIATSVTIGILPERKTVERAKELVARGFVALKLKGGADVDGDVDRIRKVREAVGPGIELRFDANQGFTVSQTVDFLRRTESLRVEHIEQPTTRDDPALLGEVKRNSHVPVMADESLMTLRDAWRIATGEWADLLNIKLMKVGGIAEAAKIDAVAEAGGIRTMVGCMDESALAIAAGLHFALARPNVAYADLDGHLDLLDDPFAAAVRLENGILHPAEGPGFGIDSKGITRPG
ncbi:MAG: dipeptide epimerase [Planctomycetales bacterium]